MQRGCPEQATYSTHIFLKANLPQAAQLPQTGDLFKKQVRCLKIDLSQAAQLPWTSRLFKKKSGWALRGEGSKAVPVGLLLALAKLEGVRGSSGFCRLRAAGGPPGAGLPMGVAHGCLTEAPVGEGWGAKPPSQKDQGGYYCVKCDVPWDVPWGIPMGHFMGCPMGHPMGCPMGRPMGRPMKHPIKIPMGHPMDIPWDIPRDVP